MKFQQTFLAGPLRVLAVPSLLSSLSLPSFAPSCGRPACGSYLPAKAGTPYFPAEAGTTSVPAADSARDERELCTHAAKTKLKNMTVVRPMENAHRKYFLAPRPRS